MRGRGHMPPAILVIEDDVDLRAALAILLEGAGYRVYQAGNGAEGMSLLKALPRMPGLILVDLIMPVMDGWQFCAEVRRLERARDVPVVILSGAWHLHSPRTRAVEATETLM